MDEQMIELEAQRLQEERKEKYREGKITLDRMMAEASTQDFSPFQNDRLVAERGSSMRLNKSAVLTAMMSDRANAEALQEAYPNLYAEAVDSREKNRKIANYNIFQKMVYKVSAEERRKARRYMANVAAAEKKLFEKRKSFFANRRKFLDDRIAVDETAYREEIAEIDEQVTDSVLHMDSSIVMDRYEDARLIERMVRDAAKREDKGGTVTQKLKRRSLLSKKELSRIRRSRKAIKTIDEMEHRPAFDVEVEYRLGRSLPGAKLALLTEREKDSEEESAQRLVDARISLHTLFDRRYSSPEDVEEKRRAFSETTAIVEKNYEECFAYATNHPEFFMGKAHPASLLSNNPKGGDDAAQADRVMGDIYHKNRQAKYTLRLINEMKDSKYFRDPYWGLDLDTPAGKLEKKRREREIEFVRSAEVYLKGFTEYVTGLFHNLDEWDRFYSQDGNPDMEKVPRYYGQTLSSLVSKYEREMEGGGDEQ